IQRCWSKVETAEFQGSWLQYSRRQYSGVLQLGSYAVAIDQELLTLKFFISYSFSTGLIVLSNDSRLAPRFALRCSDRILRTAADSFSPILSVRRRLLDKGIQRLFFGEKNSC
ncbi:MAG TPA: hypothetical protein VFO10_19320, partial [Oligoflexus sp.]|uniref:hypothetical protein n=1 Tax=Oligoflexus sp. TaxID=1971216 RepID=UPI002D7E3A72